MSKASASRIVANVAAILATGEPTHFAFEGACRHAIRAGLCLDGWRWKRADERSAEIMAEAFAAIGAQRPTWLQGQPEYTQEGYSPIERLFCVRCGKRLPDEHHVSQRYCSQLCGDAASHARRRRDESAEDRAKRLAYLALWRKRNGRA